MFRRCQHLHARCIHGDEGWARMKVYLFRWWKEAVVRRQACLDCGAALDRGPICVRYPGQHTHAGPWDARADGIE
jgi:hypothetical protein